MYSCLSYLALAYWVIVFLAQMVTLLNIYQRELKLRVDSIVEFDNNDNKLQPTYNAHDGVNIISQQLFVFCSYLAE